MSEKNAKSSCIESSRTLHCQPSTVDAGSGGAPSSGFESSGADRSPSASAIGGMKTRTSAIDATEDR